jgi:isopenicillin-N epimerase
MNVASAAPLVYDQAVDERHNALRREFLIDPEVTFLNHGAYGACPRPVFERYQAWQMDLERQPVEFLGRRLRGLMADARTRLAAYLGADADEVVYFPNVTSALNTAARSLPLEPGDEILTTDHEYGAIHRTWTFVSEHRQAPLIVQHVPLPVANPEEVVAQVWAGVTARTRVLVLSHVTSPTALTFPIQALIRRAREAGIWTAIDGAHAVGQIPVDLHALGVDFYGGNCHKWLSAPKGSGFLYVRRELQHLIEPPVVSWGWRPLDPGPSPFVDQLERQGTRDPAAYLSVAAAIDYQAERDWPRVRNECHALVRLARQRIRDISLVPELVPDDPRWFTQMAILPLPPCDHEALKRRLHDEHRIEIPVQRWRDHTWLRISVQGYTTQTDVERLTHAVGELLPHLRS